MEALFPFFGQPLEADSVCNHMNPGTKAERCQPH